MVIVLIYMCVVSRILRILYFVIRPTFFDEFLGTMDRIVEVDAILFRIRPRQSIVGSISVLVNYYH